MSYYDPEKESAAAGALSIAALVLALVAIIVLFARVASGQERREMAPVKNDGIAAWQLTPDGTNVVKRYHNGLVVTSAVTRVTTPADATPAIEKKLNERLVLDKALEDAEGDSLAEKLVRAAEKIRDQRQNDNDQGQPKTPNPNEKGNEQ